MIPFIKKNWFMLGLVAVAGVTLADGAGVIVPVGRWLKAHRGPDVVIVLVFFFSGLGLQARQIRQGIGDVKGTLVALGLIFGASPLIAAIFGLLPMPTGLLIGLFLVATMPTTMSSGVVMTGLAGGNMAHALFITIVASALAVVTIPVALTALLQLAGIDRLVRIDSLPMMVKIARLVLLPLVVGVQVRNRFAARLGPLVSYGSICNQTLILGIVWMAMCESRETLLANAAAIPPVAATAFAFHLVLVLTGVVVAGWMGLGPGRRESVIFMGGQKTLPLSVIVQVTFFSQYGVALAFCVSHHIIHLIMDAYLVQRLKAR